MVLKRIEAFGFKSFADRTVLDFPSGITAVVGSNGCGKSNISDAIRWVLGEQSAKSLRGDRMEDLIFSGTATRKPLNFAEVILTFDNSRGLFPLEFNEVSIGRRLYRTGESHYLINKQESRLRDVHDLIMDSGIGRRAHSIIEQGKIDEIVTAKPEDRRQIIEEAAGIAKYRSRRREALRKLETTREGLRRIDDLIAEMERQEGSLSRQAKKAEKFRETETELRTLEINHAAVRRVKLAAEIEVLAARRAEFEQALVAAEAELGTVSFAAESAKENVHQARERQRLDGERLFESERAYSSSESRLSEMKARQSDDEQSMIKINGEIELLKERIAAAEESEREANAAATELAEALAQLTLEREIASGALAEINERHSRVRASLESLRRDRSLALEESARTESKIIYLERTIARLESAEEQTGIALAAAETERSEWQRLAREKNDEASGLAIQRDCLVAEERQLEENVEKTRIELDGLSSEISRFGKDEAVAQSRLDSVAETADGLRTVAEALSVAPEHAAAFASALGESLDAILVTSCRDIPQTSVQHPGRTVFSGCRPTVEWTPHPSYTPLRSLLGADSPRVIHNLLAGWYFISEYDEASELLNGLEERERIVTSAGDVLYPFGGIRRPRGDEAYETAVGRDVLRKAIAAARVEIVRLEEATSAKKAALGEMESSMGTIRRRIREIDGQRSELVGHALSYEKRLAVDRPAELRADLAKAENDIAESVRAFDLARSDKESLAARCLAYSQEIESLSKDDESVATEAAGMRSRASEAEVEEGRARERHNARIAEARRIAGWTEESRRSQERYEAMVAEIQARREQLIGLIATMETTVTELAAEVSERRTTFNASEIALREAGLELEQLESRVKELSRARETRTLEIHGCEMDLLRLGGEITQVAERIKEKYGVEVATIEAAPEEEGTAARIDELRDVLSRMSGVNFAAAVELSEVSERLGFYRTQRSDLGTAESGLLEVVTDIDRQTIAIFNETFRAVNNNFGLLFNRLFGSREEMPGSAELVLLDPENPLESGIDIIAMPPGKKPQTISLLSGGEKALTAVSLLFAVFLVRPSPFAILDELDAPLDEANVGKYVQLLREFSQRSQFIIVTHNKRTMEVADTMYGVTQAEKGVSTVVGVKLAEDRENFLEAVGQQ